MRVAIVEGTTVKSIGTHEELFPNISFPSSGINSSFLADNSAKEVVDVVYDVATQKLTSVTPFIDGDYVKEYEAVSLTTDEKTAVDNSEWKGVRSIRDNKLQLSDWTQLTDSPLSDSKKTEWQTYRQALRDIPSQSDPFNITWPTEPS
tara:strand:- start:732 stop:1175 length:444 start_codon:yes stop_codon:yes gene_type:complete